MPAASLPVIDVAPLVAGGASGEVARAIGEACRTWGFFYVLGHGIDPGLQRRLEDASRRCFALPLQEKMEIRMERGGKAWRGYFPVGGELTSGRPDRKEGLYFGTELSPGDPRVRAGVPLHGANLFPEAVPELAPAVLAYLQAMTGLGQAVLRGIAESLGLAPSTFEDGMTRDPLILFRIFNYPAQETDDTGWGVGEHTDYGLLTLLKQDDAGGLQVRSGNGWIDAPPIPDAFVCNLGDMLERMTGGRTRSTPHRVRNVAGRDRLSFPFFLDPGFDTEVRPIALPDEARAAADRAFRWDGESVHAFRGTYGEYVLRKVSKVFPHLQGDGPPPARGF
jgi:isopenicillin N synthase-like dioxygenase